MASRKQIADVVSEYDRVLRLLNEACRALMDVEDDVLRITGRFGPMSPVSPLDSLAQAGRVLTVVQAIVADSKPDDSAMKPA